MAGNNQPFDFDDELLSAYLDDELAAEERARVEQRLAEDLRAKQLLEELRAVSQAMKSVPSATVGSDLRDSILRRAERAMLVPGEQSPAGGLGGVAKRIPFGRSKRAWIWAGMALAAGLMLMFFEREPERNQGLPDAVAKRDDTSQDEALFDRRSLAEERGEAEVDKLAAARPAAPASAPALAAAPAGAPASASASASAPLATVAADRGNSRLGGVGGSMAAAEDKAAEPSDAAQRLLVRVNVKPEALQNRTFDEVLERNQIEIEQPAESKSDREALAEVPQEPQDVDVLLLEAAPAQIASTLADLKADHANYLGIEVEDEGAGSQGTIANERTGYDFQQYSRGFVPLQQKVEVAPNFNYYYEAEQGPNRADRKLGRELEFAQQRSNDDRPRGLIRNRALRLKPQPTAQSGSESGSLAYKLRDQSAATAARPSAAAPAAGRFFGGTQMDLAHRAKQKLVAEAETLEVLFVLTAGPEQPANPPAAAKAVASPTAGEGLKNDDR